MVWGIPDWQKKTRLVAKRERQLLAAIKRNLSREKIIQAAENLRQAHLAVLKSEASRILVEGKVYGTFPKPDSHDRDRLNAKWTSITTEQIIEMYEKRINNPERTIGLD